MQKQNSALLEEQKKLTEDYNKLKKVKRKTGKEKSSLTRRNTAKSIKNNHHQNKDKYDTVLPQFNGKKSHILSIYSCFDNQVYKIKMLHTVLIF